MLLILSNFHGLLVNQLLLILPLQLLLKLLQLLLKLHQLSKLDVLVLLLFLKCALYVPHLQV